MGYFGDLCEKTQTTELKLNHFSASEKKINALYDTKSM